MSWLCVTDPRVYTSLFIFVVVSICFSWSTVLKCKPMKSETEFSHFVEYKRQAPVDHHSTDMTRWDIYSSVFNHSHELFWTLTKIIIFEAQPRLSSVKLRNMLITVNIYCKSSAITFQQISWSHWHYFHLTFSKTENVIILKRAVKLLLKMEWNKAKWKHLCWHCDRLVLLLDRIKSKCSCVRKAADYILL